MAGKRTEPNSAKEAGMENGWLLERRQNGSAEWVMIEGGMWDWTTDSAKALRLSRRQDADALAEIISDADYVTEHQWD